MDVESESLPWLQFKFGRVFTIVGNKYPCKFFRAKIRKYISNKIGIQKKKA